MKEFPNKLVMRKQSYMIVMIVTSFLLGHHNILLNKEKADCLEIVTVECQHQDQVYLKKTSYFVPLSFFLLLFLILLMGIRKSR